MRICVFCGSSNGARPEYVVAAEKFGQALARAGHGLVYGGGRVGLMGYLAEAVLAQGGEVVGVIPRALAEKEIAHLGLTRLEVTESMHSRKALMADLADGFVLLPGGFGSWDEFCEIVTWAQLGIHRKPCGILNVAGYYDSLLKMTGVAVEQGFLRPAHREMIVVEESAEALLTRLWEAPTLHEVKWATPQQR